MVKMMKKELREGDWGEGIHVECVCAYACVSMPRSVCLCLCLVSVPRSVCLCLGLCAYTCVSILFLCMCVYTCVSVPMPVCLRLRLCVVHLPAEKG